MVVEKGKPTQYPVPYTLWRNTKGARFTYERALEEVQAAKKRLNFFPKPADPNNPTSPWLIARARALRAVRKILRKSEYKAHRGVNSGGANAVYWLEPVLKRPDGLAVARNLTQVAKVKVDEVTEPIEPDLLYPILRGRDIRRERTESSAVIIVPYTSKTRVHPIPMHTMQNKYPQTLDT
ncbi:MAG: hypothetical protein NZ869_07830 [Thermoanaerobaculum sp.]|nr:hypothetical protein [Thermoanaerobaculum sp.]